MVGTWNRPLAILLAHKLKTCFWFLSDMNKK
jgi:hypothetical protein